jgi:hypothetical protein
MPGDLIRGKKQHRITHIFRSAKFTAMIFCHKAGLVWLKNPT